MTFLKYTICPTLESALVNLSIINNRMFTQGLLRISNVWANARPIGTSVLDNGTTLKYYYENPVDAGFILTDIVFDLPEYEQTDTDPAFAILEDYKIYDFIVADKKRVFPDRSEPPFSMLFACDLNILMAEEHLLNNKGMITQINFYESVVTTIDETTQLTSYVYSNKLVEMIFTAVVGADKYVKRITNNLKFFNIADIAPVTGELARTREIVIHEAQILAIGFRGNVILDMKTFLYENIIDLDVTIINLQDAMEETETFFEDIEDKQLNYIENGNRVPLKTKITNSGETFLDLVKDSITLRNHILTKLDDAEL